jgi:hypothetical protein
MGRTRSNAQTERQRAGMTEVNTWEIEQRWSGMSKRAKVEYLHSRGWYKNGSHWRHKRSGVLLPIGDAVRQQLEQDLAAS